MTKFFQLYNTSKMDRIILLCMVSTCLSVVHTQKFLFSPKWGPIGYKAREEHDDGTAMDEIIKANEFQASRIIDGITSLREGDIAVSAGRRSKVCFARSCLWSKSVDGHVYVAYRLSPEYSEMETKLIKKGMENIEKGTCVRFVPRTHQRDYIDIQPKSGCWSYLGSRGGRQTISLQSPDCLQVGVISHEFMHALGFVHEQSRFDRDNYVTIMWPNIWRGNFKGAGRGVALGSEISTNDRLRNFEKFKTDILDLPYDYGSIMHFGMFAYSQDGEPTIIPKNSKDIKLGQASTLSHIDKLKINKLYKCSW
ncbi:low choriolytic enzyme isoform X2 [Xiphias gladius]|uniref:low choriolytic enzyme isoform X2 n=1 Tax=Xiphias gladius TaxID=8245 RepID=UPI001A983FC3|nr:low choriolytic enzyme isoform X2 [Xiphias gladius]